MRKVGKSSKKGFTLVELIVVLVILAVLAAMLVPALVGYIDRAKKEKEFQAASTVYTAAQSLATEAYGKNKSSADAVTYAQNTDEIKKLTGVQPSAVVVEMVTPNGTGIEGFTINKIKVTFDGHDYYYTLGAATWDTTTYPTVTSGASNTGSNGGAATT